MIQREIWVGEKIKNRETEGRNIYNITALVNKRQYTIKINYIEIYYNLKKQV